MAQQTKPQTRANMQRMAPKPTPETSEYWRKAAERELWIQRCTECDKPYFYPRDFCPTCGSSAVEWFRCSGAATLYSYVIEHRAAPGFQDDVPYVVGIVELAEGPRMMSLIVDVAPDPAMLELDMPLTVTFIDREAYVLPVFTPAKDNA